MLDLISLLDTRTTALLVAFAFFIQANAIGAQAFLIREYEGVGTALLGNLSLALGFLLTTLRGFLPDFVTIVIANFFLLCGVNLFYIAISRFTGQKYSKSGIAILLVSVLFITTYYRYGTDDLVARIIGVSVCVGIGVMMVSHRLWMARNTTYSFTTWLTLIPFLIYGIFLFARAIVTFFSPPSEVFANDPVQTLTYLLLFFISFLWTLGFILMVSQRLQGDLTDLATTDSLTRIPNRRATQDFFEKELSRSQRNNSEFSILLIDLDNFKQTNDKYGHAMGDHALIKTAQIFQSAIRKQDIVGRWGGEEFLIILPGTTEQNAKILAERLRSEIANAEFKNLTLTVKITISIGIAFSDQADSMDVILKKADDALYVAKATRDAVATAR